MSDRGDRPLRRRDRLFLVLASAWNLAGGVELLVHPESAATSDPTTRRSRTRIVGGVVVAFGVLYAALAVRPVRALLIVSAIAKSVGAASGVIAWTLGKRDRVAVIALADGAWAPGFAIMSRRST